MKTAHVVLGLGAILVLVGILDNKDGASTPSTPPSAIEMLHVNFVGNHTKSEIEAEMNRAARVFNLPATDHYFNKMGSALVGMREETHIPEMELLDCARMMGEEVRGNNMNLDFPAAVGLCAASLER